jgi:hypothetical protein
VHPQRDLRLLAIAAERSLTDQQADDDAAFEITQRFDDGVVPQRAVSPSRKT